MFVRTQGFLATVIGVAAAATACTNPAEPSDLRGGPPDVLAVVVNSHDSRPPCGGSNQATCSNAPGQPIENATYCKTPDDKRPELVGTIDVTTLQVCPADANTNATEITDAFFGITANTQNAQGGLVTPVSGWYARIMFANLLDPNIEDLIPNINPTTMQPDGTFTGTLANTQPITLTCGTTAVQYDGYYSPSGNSLSYPVGPSLFIAPLDATAVPGGTECSIMVKSTVKNKAGITVPSSELGPYKFKITQVSLTSSTPSCAGNLAGCAMGDLTMPTTLDAGGSATDMGAAVVLTFDGAVNFMSLAATDVVLEEAADCMGGAPVVNRTAAVSMDVAPNAIDITDGTTGLPANQTFELGKTYILTFKSGVTVKDAAGGMSMPLPGPSDFTVCFKT